MWQMWQLRHPKDPLAAKGPSSLQSSIISASSGPGARLCSLYCWAVRSAFASCISTQTRAGCDSQDGQRNIFWAFGASPAAPELLPRGLTLTMQSLPTLTQSAEGGCKLHK